MTPIQTIEMLDEAEDLVVRYMAREAGVDELELRRRISAQKAVCDEYADRIFLDLRMRVATGMIQKTDIKVYR